MDRFTALLDQLIRDGRSLEDGLAQLRAEGAAPEKAITAIHLAHCVSLAEAKQLFASSQAWAQEAAAGAALHEEMIAHLKLESSQ